MCAIDDSSHSINEFALHQVLSPGHVRRPRQLQRVPVVLPPGFVLVGRGRRRRPAADLGDGGPDRLGDLEVEGPDRLQLYFDANADLLFPIRAPVVLPIAPGTALPAWPASEKRTSGHIHPLPLA